MNNSKRNPKRKNQLNSNSTLFLQLGILLALVLVYNILELKFYKNVFDLPNQTVLTDEPDIFIFPLFKIEKPKLPEEIVKTKLPQLLNEIKIDKDENNLLPENFIVNKPEQSVDFDSIFSSVPLIEEPDDETIPFILVEQAPRYPGCKGKSEKDFKKCFNEKVCCQKIQRKFRFELIWQTKNRHAF